MSSSHLFEDATPNEVKNGKGEYESGLFPNEQPVLTDSQKSP